MLFSRDLIGAGSTMGAKREGSAVNRSRLWRSSCCEALKYQEESAARSISPAGHAPFVSSSSKGRRGCFNPHALMASRVTYPGNG
jgi:hypothetical protein